MKHIDYCTFEKDVLKLSSLIDKSKYNSLYAIPRGGCNVALELRKHIKLDIIAKENINNNTLIIDDLIDSGNTYKFFNNNDIAVLYKKPSSPNPTYFVEEINDWIEFFYENTNTDIENNIVRILEFIGEDPNREGLLETPKRIIKMYQEILGGYKLDPKDILSKTFTQDYDEIVLLKDVEFTSMCEHHMLSFYGKAHIGYIPNGKVVGISKIARLLDCFAKRLQIQERLTNQIVDALQTYLNPQGCACVIEAQHLCMICRGIKKQNSVMITSALRGNFHKPNVKEEFIRLIKS